MPDLTRSINGWIKSESVLPAVAPMNNCGKSVTSTLRCIGRLPIQENIVHPDFDRDFHVRVRQNIEAPVLHRVNRDSRDVGGG
jgi:hypothetical protein